MVGFRTLRNSLITLLIAILTATSAFAQSSAAASSAPASSSAVPEPNNLVLLGMGVVGLILGRRAARGKKD